MALKTTLVIFAAAAALGCQVYAQVGYPGQYPGQYPGRYPGSRGPGIPRPGGRRGPASKEPKAQAQPNLQLSGVLRTLDQKSLELACTDTRFILIGLTEQTLKPAGLQAGDPVAIEASKGEDGSYHAVSIKVDVQAIAKMPPEERTAMEAERGVSVRVGPEYDQDEQGAPKLKRGIPEKVRKQQAHPVEAEPEPVAAVPVKAAAAAPHADLIENAGRQAEAFLQGLPNYVCQQVTTRYATEKHVTNWQALDVVSAELVFEDGKERYQNLQVNGKPLKKAPEESGAWSSGEFGTIIADLFHPATAADFKFERDGAAARLPVSIFDFDVKRTHSHWKIWVPAEYILPSYEGSVWVEKSTGRTLRIEMQAKDIPAAFPMDSVETAVDYEYALLGDQKFLVPVHAEVLSCFRGTNNCDKNVIEFRNYHRYAGESHIEFKP